MSLFVKAIDKMQVERARRKRDSKPLPVEKKAVLSGDSAVEKNSATAETIVLSEHARGEPAILTGEAMHRAGMMPDERAAERLKNEMRKVKRPLLNNAFGVGSDKHPKGKLILVTSALPDEGKSFVALQLALSIAAEQERTVLLIDADLARPYLTTLACGDRSMGLSEVLENPEMSVHDVMRPTDVEGVSFLSAGQHHARSTELLASDRMVKLINSICEKYPNKVVLIDSAPLLVSSDAQILSSLVGQVAMVVKAEATPVHAVRDARELLPRNVPVSAVLNQYKGSGSMGYYGGYYDKAEQPSQTPRQQASTES